MKFPESPLELQTVLPQFIKEGILSKGGCASIKIGQSVWITPKKADLLALGKKSKNGFFEIPLVDAQVFPRDVPEEAAAHVALYLARPEFRVIIHSTQENILTCSMAGETVRPFLDDMAQIVGPNAKIVSLNSEKKTFKELVAAIKRRNAVLLKGNGAFCAHGTIDDVHAVCQVLEKTCKAYVDSRILGGGKPVPRLEAEAIRFVYQRKYSKQAEKNR
ncbi:class II aldolase/adducin N-terminal domain protein [Leptospira broomii serovar Hurstbridge str. 5399]|uniref:Class II aldolase/adducin N-terminal domain protein n=1 Tax=Leptospira broomii serovar Hurstbridge str. 5399 TaxID=1049789 RepID=T0F152_9LEPT|nr:class II aldolase/adducin family protein [Leptospira broomii]EQA44885.1 class II aldolase/adducin N-terminal domain protein [Leptospira broomii serovar Hurstbridge str. 5399]